MHANSARNSAEIGSQLVAGKNMGEIANITKFKTPVVFELNSVFLAPVTITKDSLNVVIGRQLGRQGHCLPEYRGSLGMPYVNIDMRRSKTLNLCIVFAQIHFDFRPMR